MPAAPSPTNDPGFDLYADQRGRIIGTMVSIYILTTSAVALRFLSRKLSRAGLWWDDWLSLAALIVSLTCPSIWLYELRNGFGRHIFIFTPEEQVAKASAWLRGLWVFELIFHTATTISKFAILAFYYRIFPVPKFQRLLKWVAGLCVIYMVGIDLTIIFQCQPIHFAWDQVNPKVKGHCFNEDAFFVGSGSVNAALNLLVFILPIPLLYRLRTTAKQQMVLTAVFTLAGFVVLVSIIWVVVLSNLQQADVTWNYIDTAIWSALEPNMAVVCACIPSLRPLFNVMGRGFSHAPPSHGVAREVNGRVASSKRMWSTSVSQSGMEFSQLDDGDDMRPLGHDVDIRGGRVLRSGSKGGEEVEALALPEKGINVVTEVTLITSDRLDYNDRLF